MGEEAHAAKESKKERLMLFNTINCICFCENVLFCDKCSDWLTVPIYNHPEKLGVYLCMKCMKGTRKDEQNGDMGAFSPVGRCAKMEDILCSKFYPCKNFNQGCGVAMRSDLLHKHEQNCDCGFSTTNSFKCINCEFESPSEVGLREHYESQHRIRTVVAKDNCFNLSVFIQSLCRIRLVCPIIPVNLVFIKFGSYFMAVKLDNNFIQLCEPLESLPNFKAFFTCNHCGNRQVIPVQSNWNQLHEKASVGLCHCFLHGFFHIDVLLGLPISYELQNCCNFSFTARDHLRHIKSMHTVLSKAFIKRSDLTVQGSNVQYLNVNGNIFKLHMNTLTILYWFAGNYDYNCYIIGKDPKLVVKVYINNVITFKLPDLWDMLYIFYRKQL